MVSQALVGQVLGQGGTVVRGRWWGVQSAHTVARQSARQRSITNSQHIICKWLLLEPLGPSMLQPY